MAKRSYNRTVWKFENAKQKKQHKQEQNKKYYNKNKDIIIKKVIEYKKKYAKPKIIHPTFDEKIKLLSETCDYKNEWDFLFKIPKDINNTDLTESFGEDTINQIHCLCRRKITNQYLYQNNITGLHVILGGLCRRKFNKILQIKKIKKHNKPNKKYIPKDNKFDLEIYLNCSYRNFHKQKHNNKLLNEYNNNYKVKQIRKNEILRILKSQLQKYEIIMFNDGIIYNNILHTLENVNNDKKEKKILCTIQKLKDSTFI